MKDVLLEARLRRFSLLRTPLDRLASPHGAIPKAVRAAHADVPDAFILASLKNQNHPTTRGLARFVCQHHYGPNEPFDFFDLWRRLDVEGRDELIAYLREEF